MDAKKELVFKTTKTFIQRFYRFPTYIKAGGTRIEREQIIALVEDTIGKPFYWYKRYRVVGQLEDAIRLAKK